MKNHSELLDDVLEGNSPGNAPSASRVVALIRREKSARGRRRCLAAVTAASVLTLAALPLVRRTGTSPEPSAVAAVGANTAPEIAAEIEPRGFEIARIGDEELMDLLDEQPSALVQFPDGERQLMLVVGQSFSAGDLEAMDANAAWNQPYNR